MMNIEPQALINSLISQRNRAFDDAAQLNAALETAMKRIKELEEQLKEGINEKSAVAE